MCLPINMNGTIGPQGEKVKEFGDLLKEEGFSENIIYWDERLTSMQVFNRIMIDADVSRKKRKENVDMMAAIYPAEHLDFINNQKRGN